MVNCWNWSMMKECRENLAMFTFFSHDNQRFYLAALKFFRLQFAYTCNKFKFSLLRWFSFKREAVLIAPSITNSKAVRISFISRPTTPKKANGRKKSVKIRNCWLLRRFFCEEMRNFKEPFEELWAFFVFFCCDEGEKFLIRLITLSFAEKREILFFHKNIYKRM